MINNLDSNALQFPHKELNARYLFSKILAKWPWFLLSMLLCLGLTYFYLKYTTPMYKISARLLINDEKKGGIADAVDLASLGGLVTGKSSVDNEVEILKSRLLMEQVVRSMDLNIVYYKEERFKQEELYKAPFLLEFNKVADTIQGGTFKVKFLKNDRVYIKGEDFETTVHIDSALKIPGVGIAKIKVRSELPVLHDEYLFSVTSTDSKVASLMANLTVGLDSKTVTIIDLDLNHAIPKKGEDILNELMKLYVQGTIKDKNVVADSTIKFIQERLQFIGVELGDVEGNIESFKRRNSLVDMSEQSKLLVQNTSSFVNEQAKIETQLLVLDGLQKYLENEAENERVLPSSLLPSDDVFSGLMQRYNALLLDKDKHLLSTTEKNPVMINLNGQIRSLRKDMLSSLISTKASLIVSKQQLAKQISGVEGKIKQVPQTERDYLKLARQQQIKQELYIFLMQKAEETAISKTSNLSNSKMVDPPKSEVFPFSPKKNIFYLAGFFAGLLFPVGFVVLAEMLNDKVENRDDVLRLTNVPILGEISHNNEMENLIVANNSRSVIAEQFRALRTNLSFYLKNEDQKVILLTSSMSGEGKSFVSINLANILAISNKKVLLMEFDLRKPGLSVKLGIENTFGFTNYLISDKVNASDLIKPLALHPNLFLISSGPIPPNPAEMLMDSRTAKLMAELKEQFDYIIIDAPPIGIVTDAQLLSQYADICLYLVRQKYTVKEQLNIVQNLYTEQRMKQLGIVVNDIQISDGYGYGYGYGYGQGYGDYGNEEKKQGFFKGLNKNK
jgi:tyrosine-protein kinase Etk/Wzc